MPETRRRSRMTAQEEKQGGNDVICISVKEEKDSLTEMEIQRNKLRQRWELASILNFLHVFEPVIQSNMKISAEEIETALIEPNDSLAQLHIVLLKGVVPSSKMLNVPDAWVSILSKKLAIWWPWVAEGDFPLTAAKGEEMHRYKELDPTIRLYILKALCEMRVDRDDIVTYINDNIKNGTGLSTFQKEKLGEDGRGTSYWYDGNENVGHRLYKEVKAFELKPKVKGRVNGLNISYRWETLATNFEEFHKVLSEFSSSKVQLEVAVGKAVEANVTPTLERIQKKKERKLKQQRRQEMLLTVFQNSAIARSGRTRRAVSYRFEEFDKAIKEAIEVTQNRKPGDRHKGSSKPADSSDCGSDSITEKHQHVNANDVYIWTEENDKVADKNMLEHSSQNQNGWSARRSNGGRSGGTVVEMKVSEGTGLATKRRLRQRPTINTAIDSAIILDSEDESPPSKEMNKRGRISGTSSQSAGSDDDFSS